MDKNFGAMQANQQAGSQGSSFSNMAGSAMNSGSFGSSFSNSVGSSSSDSDLKEAKKMNSQSGSGTSSTTGSSSSDLDEAKKLNQQSSQKKSK